jgi:hypothetical protein
MSAGLAAIKRTHHGESTSQEIHSILLPQRMNERIAID